jgi:hypothetical protein
MLGTNIGVKMFNKSVYIYEKESDLPEAGIYALTSEDGDFESMKIFLNRPEFL